MIRHQKKQLFTIFDAQNLNIQTQNLYKQIVLSDASGSLNDVTFTKSNSNIRIFWYRPADSIYPPNETHEPSIGAYSTHIGKADEESYFAPLMFYSSDQTTVHNQYFCLYDEPEFQYYQNKFIDTNIFKLLAEFIQQKLRVKIEIIYNLNDGQSYDTVTIKQTPVDGETIYYQVYFDGSIFEDIFINNKTAIGNLNMILNANDYDTCINSDTYLQNLNPKVLQQDESFIFHKQCNLQSLLSTFYINIQYLNILNNNQEDKPQAYINKHVFKVYYQESMVGKRFLRKPVQEQQMFYTDNLLEIDDYYVKPEYKNQILFPSYSYKYIVTLNEQQKSMHTNIEIISEINSTMFFRFENTIFITSKQCQETVGILSSKNLIVTPLSRSIFCWKDMTNKTNKLSFQIQNKTLNEFNKLITQDDESLEIFVRFLVK